MFISAWRSIWASSSGETSPIAPPPCARMASMDSRSVGPPSSPSPIPDAWSEKYTSKTVSKARQWWWFFTRVAPSAALNVPRSAMSTCSTARMASRFSVIDTGSPAARSSWMNPCSTSSMESRSPAGGASVGPNLDMASFSFAGFTWCTASRSGWRSARRQRPALDLELLAGLGDVGLVLEEHVQRLADQLGVDLVLAQVQERLRPVDGLGDRRRLLQLELPDRPHDARDLLGQLVVDVGHAHPDDVLLALEVRVV